MNNTYAINRYHWHYYLQLGFNISRAKQIVFEPISDPETPHMTISFLSIYFPTYDIIASMIFLSNLPGKNF